jgi:hypothetical protein
MQMVNGLQEFVITMIVESARFGAQNGKYDFVFHLFLC